MALSRSIIYKMNQRYQYKVEEKSIDGPVHIQEMLNSWAEQEWRVISISPSFETGMPGRIYRFYIVLERPLFSHPFKDLNDEYYSR